MNTRKRSNQAIEVAQILLWVMICILPPMFIFLLDHDWQKALDAFRIGFKLQSPFAAIYFINFYLIVPHFLFRLRNFRNFVIANLFLLTAVSLWIYYPSSEVSPEWKSVLWTIIISSFILQLFVVAFAVGMRYVIRWNEMELKQEAESRRNTEAELVWLKNQLNPHFLFNTLNNISSLIQVDADTAQESLGQLSDLLRYALYESSQKEVSLADELSFMKDYIDLMKLRCNENAEINVDFPEHVPNIKIIPLLFISPIENAFKHGINNRLTSFVRIKLSCEKDKIYFYIENSCHPKADTDRIGSGIGVENLRRRLELAYPGRHVYKQFINETICQTTITIEP